MIPLNNSDKKGLKKFLVLVEPLQVRHRAAHVSVGNVVVRVRVASNGRIRTTLNDKSGVSLIRVARTRVIDENITSLDVGWRSLVLATGASPAMSAMETITKILSAHFLLAARITTARTTLIQSLVTTSKEALTDKVGTITTIAAIVAVLTAPIRPGRARGIRLLAIVVGTIPPFLSISNSSTAVISCSKTAETKKSNKSNCLHFFFLL